VLFVYFNHLVCVLEPLCMTNHLDETWDLYLEPLCMNYSRYPSQLSIDMSAIYMFSTLGMGLKILHMVGKKNSH